MTILVALDNSAAAAPVCAAARRLGSLLEIPVEAVHVAERDDDGAPEAVDAARAAGVPFRLRAAEADGVVATLEADMRERGATVLVIGAREEEAAPLPAGHVTLDVVQSADCTVVVVPPGAEDRPLRRVVVAVEGKGESRGLRGLFRHLGSRAAPEVIALHVIEPDELPPFADSPVLEADAFTREFGIRSAGDLARSPAGVRFEFRIGEATEALRTALSDLDADLVVLAWHRDLSPGRARMVREMVARSRVPVVLLPTEPARKS